MGDLLGKLVELVKDGFTAQRVAILGVIFIVIVWGLSFFEHYTATFRLARLQKATETLVQLQQASLAGPNASAELQEVRRSLEIKLNNLAAEDPWLDKLLVPWIVIAWTFLVLAPFALAESLRVAFKKAAAKAQTIQCVNNLRNVGLSARVWATDHSGLLPSSAEEIQENLPQKKIPACPATDRDWLTILSPGISEKDPCVVYARCALHGNVLLADGSVQQLGIRRLVCRNANWQIVD